jgi:raffinose/stachyose/melibiose transport system substrate-binding protein
VVVIKGIHQFPPGAAFQPQLQQLTDEFNAAHPNIHVEWDWAGFETYFQKVQIALESDQQLDLLQRAGIRDLGMGDNYLNLNEYMNSPSYDDPNVLWKDTFPESIVGEGGLYWLDGVPQGPGIYGVPNEFIVEGVWYNKDLFEQHSIAIPTTYDEFIAVCDTLRAAGVAPVLQDNDSGYNANIWIELAGFTAGEQAFIEAASGEGTFDTPEFIQAAELAQNFATHCFQDAWTGYQWPSAQTLLAQGGGAMNVNGSWLPSELGPVLPEGFRFGFFRMPPVEAGKGTPNMMQSIINGFVILKKSQHPDEAAEYLKFLSSKGALETVAAQGNFMARKEISVPPALADVPAVIADSTLVSRAFGAYEDYQDWYQTISWKYGDQLLVGALTPEEFATQLEQATDEYWANR